MARNPYQVLGLTSSAGDAEIRAAFRKLAKQHHPDRNPGDAKAEETFKEISAAFDILGDKEKRAKFDRGEIDAEGRERAYNPFGGGAYPGGQGSGGYGGFGGAHGPGGQGPGGPGAGASFEDLGDIFADLFGARRASAVRGRDLRYRLEVAFLDAARGAKKRVTMPDGRTLDLSIPPGVDDGQTLRLKGQGEAGAGGGPAGDVYVEIKVTPHEKFERKGADIHIETPISLKQAVLGGKITAPTVHGDVTLNIPPWSNSGAVLRLKGRGVAAGKSDAAGDQYVKLKIVLPEGGDAELEAFIRRWDGGADADAKKDFEQA
ncbi:MAG: J domain-containing protein [Pseudomonadota bacterium]